MAQKHLKELLKEDQEPFYLKDYIADRTSQFKKQPSNNNTKLQLKKPKQPTSSILCKNACFFSSLQNSPDFTKSPKLFDFPPSPLPNKSPNKKVLLHVPAKTAALLLEAAVRIQTHKSRPKTTTHVKTSGLSLFGSMLKRLTLRKNNTNTPKFKTDDLKIEGKKGEEKIVRDNNALTYFSSSPSCNGRLSSLDLDSSSSGRSFEEDDEFEFANVLRENNDDVTITNEYSRTEVGYGNRNNNGDYFSGLCLSPLSPFRFALHKSPSPELQSPVKSSPLHRTFQDTNNYEYESLAKFQEDEDEDEDDKEQNSPVSVLDPPFEDDYDGHEDESLDVECNYAFVHRAHEELLHKLHRFEKLAELDPIELEKRMIEAEEEYLLEKAKEIEEDYDCDSFTYDKQEENNLCEVIRKSGFQDMKKPGIKRLISDLIIEEDIKENASDEQVMKRICKRLESWKEVESNTIEMMVEMDLKTDVSDWKNPREEINKSAIDIEIAIFAILVEELIEDLA